MKKILLLVVILALVLSGCGKTNAAPAALDTKPTATPAPVAETTPAPTPEPAPEPEPETEPEEPAEEPASPIAAVVDPELKEFLDSYEDFVDSYIEFMEEYKKNPTDMNLMLKYTSIMTEYMEFAEAVEAYDSEDLSDADALYYSEVCLRCSQKLLKAAY